jgi:hypothetical protein
LAALVNPTSRRWFRDVTAGRAAHYFLRAVAVRRGPRVCAEATVRFAFDAAAFLACRFRFNNPTAPATTAPATSGMTFRISASF